MKTYTPPVVSELGTLAQVTEGGPVGQGNDFLLLSALDRGIEGSTGDEHISC